MVVLWSGVLASVGYAAEPESRAEGPLVVVSAVLHAPIKEQSAIVQSQRWPGTFWVTNDSGNGPYLFAVDGEGKALMPPFLGNRYEVGPYKRRKAELWPGLELVGASNIDWESLAIGNDTLFVADMGNNGNARRDLGVYVLPEPNPLSVDRVRPTAFWPIAYPGQTEFPATQWHYDCEAVFHHSGRLYFLTKHRAPGELKTPETSTDLYRLDTTFTDRVNVLTHVDHHDDLGGWVTAADLSPNGKTLAVLALVPEASVWLFDAPEVGDAFLSSKSRRITLDRAALKQAEGLVWADDRKLILTNEQRQRFELAVP